MQLSVAKKDRLWSYLPGSILNLLSVSWGTPVHVIDHCDLTALFGVFWQLSNIKISNVLAGILDSPTRICLLVDGGLTFDTVKAYARLGPNLNIYIF